jgi:hypothetical protein
MTQVQTEIDRLESAKAAIATAIAGKGVSVPAGTKIDGMAHLVQNIQKEITAFKTGTVTFTSDQDKYFYVQHDLGVVPNVFMFYYAGDVDSANFTDELFCNMFTGKHINTPEYLYIGVQLTLGAYDDDVAHNVTWMADGQWLVDENVIELTRTSYYKCKAGMTYNWIAARIEGLD